MTYLTKKSTKIKQQDFEKESQDPEIDDVSTLNETQTPKSDDASNVEVDNSEAKPSDTDAEINLIEEKLKVLENEIADKDQKLQSLEEQILRNMAEFENYKRRKELEKEDAIKFSLKTFFEGFLPVLDSFDLAKDTFEKNNLDSAVLDGFSMIYQQVLQLLDKNKVEKIKAINEPFNPEYHQAILQEESDQESQTIIKVMQEGFIYEGRVLRPAMVVVSK